MALYNAPATGGSVGSAVVDEGVGGLKFIDANTGLAGLSFK